MEFAQLVELHRRWHRERRMGEDSVLPALSALKPVAKLANLYVRSREKHEVGVDWHALVSEAIGDVLMYTLSYADCNGLTVSAPLQLAPRCDASLLVAELAIAVCDLAQNSPRQGYVNTVLAYLERFCSTCCIDLLEAGELSLGKALTK